MHASGSLQTWIIKSRKNCGAISHVDFTWDILQGPGTKLKAGAETTSTTGGDGPREAGQLIQFIKRHFIFHPYSIGLKEFLEKPSKDAGNPSLGGECGYCGVTSKKILTDLDKHDCRQLLVVRTCMFVKAYKFNHRKSTKQQVATIKENLICFQRTRWLSQVRINTLQNKLTSCLYHRTLFGLQSIMSYFQLQMCWKKEWYLTGIL